MASGSLFARNAMRVDAEYDGGNSDIDDDDDSEGDLSQSPAKLDHVNSRCRVCGARALLLRARPAAAGGCILLRARAPPPGRVSGHPQPRLLCMLSASVAACGPAECRKIKLGKLGKKGKEEATRKKQKTGNTSSMTSSRRRLVGAGGASGAGDRSPEKSAKMIVEPPKQKETGAEDSVEEELAREAASLATKRKPPVDESLRTISSLLEQTRQTQRGLAAQHCEADVSACDETQASEVEAVNRGVSHMDVVSSPVNMDIVQPQCTDKVLVCIRRQGEKPKKFKIFMTDPMGKAFEAFCEAKNLDIGSVRFIFDGLPVQGNKTPQDLDMEVGEENLVDAKLR